MRDEKEEKKMELWKNSYSVDKSGKKEVLLIRSNLWVSFVPGPTIMEDKPLVMNKNIHRLFLPKIKFQFNTLAPFSATLPMSLPKQRTCIQLTEKLPIQAELCSHGRLFLCSHVSQWFPFNQNHLPKEMK